MIFLIEYDRPEGRIVRLESFEDSDQSIAASLRLEIELALNRQRVGHEVVLLQATSLKALRRTHRRYFETASEIVRSTSAELRLSLSFAVGTSASPDDRPLGGDAEAGPREPHRG